MRLGPLLVLALLVLGCGGSGSAPSSPPADGGAHDGSADDGGPIPDCFGDGWCAEGNLGTALLVDVWASGANDAWAIGQDANVWRWNGSAWSSTKLAGAQGNAIWGRAAGDVWAAIDDGIQHWDGAAWKPEPVSPPATLIRFAVDDTGTVWARTGNDGVYRRTGSSWVAVLKDGVTSFPGASIAPCDGKVYFAAGLMADWDGTSIWMHGFNEDDDRVIAAGTYGSGHGWVSSRWLRRRVGGELAANVTEGAPKGLFSMSVVSDTEAWALAEGPSLWSFDGTTWRSWTTDVKDMISVSYLSAGVLRLMTKSGAMYEVTVASGARTQIAKPLGAPGFSQGLLRASPEM